MAGIYYRRARPRFPPGPPPPAPRAWVGGVGGGPPPVGLCYSRSGPISWAKLFRARLRRLFTVPRLHPVLSAISAELLPSNSRSTEAAGWWVGSWRRYGATAVV